MDGIALSETGLEFDRLFEAHYGRVARVIARVVRDPARAEELAVDVFWKFRNFQTTRQADPEAAMAWIRRTAVRTGLDELRRKARAARYESLLGRFTKARTPEQLRAAGEEQEQVRSVLARLKARDAELLVLRADELSYGEIAAALKMKPGSVGTLLARAQQAFRKEYVKRHGVPRYGEPRYEER